MFIVPHSDRLREGILGSDDSYGNNGMFIIKHPKIMDYFFAVQASDGMGWEHVSVTLKKKILKTVKAHRKHSGPVSNEKGTYIHRQKEEVWEEVPRCPTWEEMCFIKDKFWTKDECVVQYHPAETEYVNLHPHCLHLWRPTDQIIPQPDKTMVG